MPRRPPYFTPTGPPRWWYTVALGLWIACFGLLAVTGFSDHGDGFRSDHLVRASAEEPHTVEVTLDEPGTRILYLEFPNTEEQHPWHLVPSGQRPIAIWLDPEPDGDPVRYPAGLEDYTTQVDGTAVWGFGTAEIDLAAGDHVIHVESQLPLDDARLVVAEPVRGAGSAPGLAIVATALLAGAVALVTALLRRSAARRIHGTAQGA
ncbi:MULTISPECIES: hypothetical protein [unclassified Nocardiopsis]|uniref:hypothetical protein n=1 Tax=Nocardiopsis TaxID=2013 RepID=UPI00387AF5A1